MTNENDELQEPLELQSLKTSIDPPENLEERVVARLRKRNLIGTQRRPWVRFVLIAAACLIFFALGRIYERHPFFPKPSATQVSMSDSTYVLFLRVGSAYQRPADRQQQMERVKAYREWAVGLRSKGMAVAGTKLRNEKSILGISDALQQEEVAGYFLIDATDPDQAMNIARGCPHLKYGGTIEIRRVDPV